MSTVFAAIFSVYLASVVYANWSAAGREQSVPSSRALALQTPVVVLALVIAWQAGYLGRELVAAWFIAGGFLVGYAAFALSMLLTRGWSINLPFLRELCAFFANGRARWNYFVEHPRRVQLVLLGSIGEELIYRAAAQTVLLAWTGSAWWAIAVVAVVFSAAHRHFLRNAPRESFEFLLFALLLGGLLHLTGSLTLVIVVHAIRNFEIDLLEHLSETEGGEALDGEMLEEHRPAGAAPECP